MSVLYISNSIENSDQSVATQLNLFNVWRYISCDKTLAGKKEGPKSRIREMRLEMNFLQTDIT